MSEDLSHLDMIDILPLFAYIATEALPYLLWSIVANTDIGFAASIFWHGALISIVSRLTYSG